MGDLHNRLTFLIVKYTELSIFVEISSSLWTAVMVTEASTRKVLPIFCQFVAKHRAGYSRTFCVTLVNLYSQDYKLIRPEIQNQIIQSVNMSEFLICDL